MGKMVSRLLEQEEAVRIVLSSDRKTSHLIPSWQDTQIWESISKALSFIADLTDFLSGDSHVTIASIKPVLQILHSRALAEDSSDIPLTREINKNVLDSLDFQYLDSKLKKLLNVATLLDPQFKTDYVEGEDLASVEDMIIDHGLELIPESQAQEQEMCYEPLSNNRHPRKRSL